MRKILLIALLFPFVLIAQQEIIDSSNFDVDIFNKYVLEEVNKLRKRNRVDSLVFDNSLDAACNDHVGYMAENKVLSHAQKSKFKNAPYDRVVYYGGSHSKVGENIQLVPLDYRLKKSKYRLTYQKLAKEIVGNWKKSSAHYKNMINGDYTGVSQQYLVKDGVLYCCQLLASKPFKETYAFDKGKVLFVKNKKPCRNCKKTRRRIDKDEAHLGWYSVSNDSIYYLNANVIGNKKNNLKKIFKRKGVIAVDVIHQEQYDCSGNPSLHNSLYFDGYYIGFVSKAKLSQDLESSPDLLKIFIGMKPVFVDTFFQVDLNLLKKWKPCLNGMTIYMNPDFLAPNEYFEIPNPKIVGHDIILTDSINIRIPFKSGQTDQDTSIFYPLITELNGLVKQDYAIKSIYFTGVASIEGTEEGNKLLFQRRGEIIENYLSRYYPDFHVTSEFYENFDDFRSGLVTKGISEAMTMSEDSLRMYANRNRKQLATAKLLDDSRYSSIRIVYQDIIPIQEGGYGLSVRRLQDLIQDKNYHEMVPLYELFAHKAMQGNQNMKDSLFLLEIPETEAYAKLNWYEFVLGLNLKDEKINYKKLNELAKNGAILTDADFLEYRLMFNIFNGDEDIKVEDFTEIHDQVRGKRQKAWIECLELIMGVENYRYSDKMAVPILLETVLKKKFDIKKTYFICQYLIEWGYTVEPYILLSKFAKRSGQFAKLYTQYLKLAYFLGQFEEEKEWKKIRNIFKSLANQYPDDFCNLFKWNEMGVRSLDIPEIAFLFCEKCRTKTP